MLMNSAGVIKSAGLIGKRAQEMPMQTIVMIIIVLLVLAGVGIFFFTQFTSGQQGTSSSQCIQLCQSMRSQMSQNDTITWTTLTPTAAATTGAAKEFCIKKDCNGFACTVRKDPGNSIDQGQIYGNDGRCPADNPP
jgi:hypothetical protein